jgi:8-oxo-dGTP pyrophosphatase MutT (NUDIX family)
MTLGVRGLVIDEAGRVLLIQHTYVKGWHLPGGGVDRGEAAETAVIRELVEEVGIVATSRPRLLSVHNNHARFRGDHVLYYRIESWEQGQATSVGEIDETQWFHPDDLPEGVTASTRRRIEEAMGLVEVHPDW